MPFWKKHDSKPPSSVKQALEGIIASALPGSRGGFVIFGGKRPLDYVQYALDPNGLQLNWPTMQDGGHERLPLFLDYLNANGFTQITVDTRVDLARQIMSMQKGQYVVLDDGLYCQVGRNIEEIHRMTLDLMAGIFEVLDEQEFAITYEPNG